MGYLILSAPALFQTPAFRAGGQGSAWHSMWSLAGGWRYCCCEEETFRIPGPWIVAPASFSQKAARIQLRDALVARGRSGNHRGRSGLRFHLFTGKSVQDRADNSVAAGNTKGE